MDRATAEQVLTTAIGPHVASLLAPDDIARALDSSRTPDPQGRTPGQSGYIETTDTNWEEDEPESMQKLCPRLFERFGE